MEFNSNFRYDLKVGQMAEQALADILQNKTIEVKRDLKFKVTGNIFIEFESRGKPSGIATSEADYWCFVLDEIYILLKTQSLKELIDPLKGTDRQKRGGDKNTSVGVLLKVTDLMKQNNNNE